MIGTSAQQVSTAENPIPCPIPSPNGLPCTKTIPPGWHVDEGHAGGHFWAGARTAAILAGGHYDSTAAIAGQPFAGHLPDECEPPCQFDRLRTDPKE